MAAVDMLEALPSASADLIATDPPYGIDLNMSFSRGWTREAQRTPNFGDDVFDPAWLSGAYRVLKDTGSLYMFTQFRVLGQWWQALEMTGFNVHSCIVWDKLVPGIGNLNVFGNQCELILFASKTANPTIYWEHNRARYHRRGNVWALTKLSAINNEGNFDNPAQKPEALMRTIIGLGSVRGDVVIDPFVGTGSTAVVAQQMGRLWYACDLNAEQVRISNLRLLKPYTEDMFLG